MSENLLGIDALGKYASNLIRVYPRWFLVLHRNQRLIGRCYVWWRVPGTYQNKTGVPAEDIQEMEYIRKRWYGIVRDLFDPTLCNYAWLGNEYHEHSGHGHEHFIPRYRHDVTFLGECFRDELFGHNYDHSFNQRLPPRILSDKKQNLLVHEFGCRTD